MILRSLYFLLLAILLISCEKQTPEPALALSEYIIGDWEEREYMDISAFGNREFNSIGPPYEAVYCFKEDQSYILWFRGNPEGPLSYSVNEQDSFLIMNGTNWKLFAFNESFIEIQISGGGGPVGKRLYKID
ncbi:MAG: hypothetical protein Sapg2KO_46490 [Saprospiraceae bacterium]